MFGEEVVDLLLGVGGSYWVWFGIYELFYDEVQWSVFCWCVVEKGVFGGWVFFYVVYDVLGGEGCGEFGCCFFE